MHLHRQNIPPAVPRGAARLVYWYLAHYGPSVDRRMEKALSTCFGIEPSTARGARNRLSRMRIVARVGRGEGGRLKWAVVSQESERGNGCQPTTVRPNLPD